MTSRTESSTRGSSRADRRSSMKSETWRSSSSGTEGKKTSSSSEWLLIRFENVNNNNNVFLLRVSCAGLKPGWRRLWPAAGSKTTSYPLTTSCRRTWRRWTGAHAGFRSTPGSTPWRPGWLAFSLVHTHTPVQKPDSHCKRGKKKSVCVSSTRRP